jgi:hypothetical protein
VLVAYKVILVNNTPLTLKLNSDFLSYSDVNGIPSGVGAFMYDYCLKQEEPYLMVWAVGSV